MTEKVDLFLWIKLVRAFLNLLPYSYTSPLTPTVTSFKNHPFKTLHILICLKHFRASQTKNEIQSSQATQCLLECCRVWRGQGVHQPSPPTVPSPVIFNVRYF